MTTTRQVTATARDAGRNVVHTVHAVYQDGTPAPVAHKTRRSAHRYAYAICHWATIDWPEHGPARTVIVDRWSKSPKTSGGKFAVAVESVEPKRRERSGVVVNDPGMGRPMVSRPVRMRVVDGRYVRVEEGQR